jgi:hypothetical protein
VDFEKKFSGMTFVSKSTKETFLTRF